MGDHLRVLLLRSRVRVRHRVAMIATMSVTISTTQTTKWNAQVSRSGSGVPRLSSVVVVGPHPHLHLPSKLQAHRDQERAMITRRRVITMAPPKQKSRTF